MSVRIPSNIDQEDRILAGLTARQLAIVALPAVLLWALYFATRTFVPLYVFGPIAIVLAGIVGTVAVTKRDGISMDRFALAAIRYHRSPRQMVPLANEDEFSGLASIPLSIVGIDASGVIDLGSKGSALICRADAVDIGLLSDVEQEATVVAFGRFANSLQTSVQFVLHTEAAELSEMIGRIRSDARSLAAMQLERAAVEHCAFLAELSERHDVLQRRAYLVFRENESADVAASLLVQRAAEAATALRSAGVDIRPLNRDETAGAIQSSCGAMQVFGSSSQDITTGVRR